MSPGSSSPQRAAAVLSAISDTNTGWETSWGSWGTCGCSSPSSQISGPKKTSKAYKTPSLVLMHQWLASRSHAPVTDMPQVVSPGSLRSFISRVWVQPFCSSVRGDVVRINSGGGKSSILKCWKIKFNKLIHFLNDNYKIFLQAADSWGRRLWVVYATWRLFV